VATLLVKCYAENDLEIFGRNGKPLRDKNAMPLIPLKWAIVPVQEFPTRSGLQTAATKNMNKYSHNICEYWDKMQGKISNYLTKNLKQQSYIYI